MANQQPIQSGYVQAPLLRFHRDNPLRLTVTVDDSFPLTTMDVRFVLQPKGMPIRKQWIAGEAGASLTVAGQVITLLAEPDSGSDTDANFDLSAIQALGAASWELSIRGDISNVPKGIVIVGDMEWIAIGTEDESGPNAAISNPDITLDIVDEELTLTITGGGEDGREVELRSNAGRLEWRYVGDPTWIDLGLIGNAAHASSHVTGGADKIRDATASQDGLMTSAYATKLDGIEASANNYSLPAPTTTALGGVKRNTGAAGQFVTGIDTDGSLLRDTPAGSGVGTVTSVAVSGSDGIEIDSGSPVTTSGTIALGVNASTLKTHIALNNVENTALSTFAGSANITTLGTIATGTVPVANISGLGTAATTSATDYAPALGPDDNYVTDAEKTVIGNTSGTNTGDNAVNSLYSGLVSNATHTGDVTGATELTIANNAVTFAKIQTISSETLIGRHGGGTGNPQSVSVGNGIEFSGSGIRRAALTGDVTATAGSNATTIANGAVTEAKCNSSINASLDLADSSIQPGNAALTDERVPTAAGLSSKFGTNKATIADGDKFAILDSAATDAPKHSLFSLVKSTLKTYFDTLYAAALGSDDNYVTDAEKTVLGNTSGTNTGDQDLSGYVLTTAIDTLAELNSIITDATLIDTNDARLSDARTPTSHTHGNLSNDGKVGSTSGLPIKTGSAGVVEAGAFGTGAGEFAQGNDSRFHVRSHTITSTDDHTAGNHKVFYSNGSGQLVELALGADGTVLQSNGATSAPTFETPTGGSSGAMVLIASATASSSAELLFDNKFDSAVYAEYYIIFKGVSPATDNVDIRVVLRNSSSADMTSTYRWGQSGTRIDAVGNAAASNLNSTAGYAFALSTGSDVNERTSGRITITPIASWWTIFHGELYANGTASERYLIRHTGAYEDTTNPAGIRIFCSSGNIAIGEFYLYGIKK